MSIERLQIFATLSGYLSPPTRLPPIAESQTLARANFLLMTLKWQYDLTQRSVYTSLDFKHQVCMIKIQIPSYRCLFCVQISSVWQSAFHCITSFFPFLLCTVNVRKRNTFVFGLKSFGSVCSVRFFLFGSFFCSVHFFARLDCFSYK